MKTLTITRPPMPVLDELKGLCILLQDVQNKNELIANTVSDNRVKRVLWGLAQGCCQYANELNCHLQSLGANPDDFQSYTSEIIKQEENLLPEFTRAQDIWTYCAKNELKVLKAYRLLLNKSILNDGIQKMIRYQFNGLLYIFLQIRQLRS